MLGKFITIEGCDGSGKTTQAKLLKEKLIEMKTSFWFTREPGGTKISEKIREVILAKENKEMVWRTEALLYAASRAQLMGEKILPLLNEGVNVICDRFIDSTMAYQGYGRKLDKLELEKLNVFATEGVKPDLTILLDIEPEEAFKRITGREQDRLETEKIDFHQRVREGYLTLARFEPERFKVISALLPEETIHEQILKIVLPLLAEN